MGHWLIQHSRNNARSLTLGVVRLTPSPALTADHSAPLHRARWGVYAPPAVVKPPPTSSVDVQERMVTHTRMRSPRQSHCLVPISLRYPRFRSLAAAAFTRPASVNSPPTYSLPLASTAKAYTGASMPVSNADHATPSTGYTFALQHRSA